MFNCKVVKVKSKKTYKGADGKQHNYYNYYLQFENGKRIGVKCVSNADYQRLDMTAEYVG